MPSDENDRRISANEYLSTKKIIYKNFIGGIFWGLGSVLGATLFVALAVGVLRSFDFVPFIGDFITQILNYIDNKQFTIR